MVPQALSPTSYTGFIGAEGRHPARRTGPSGTGGARSLSSRPGGVFLRRVMAGIRRKRGPLGRPVRRGAPAPRRSTATHRPSTQGEAAAGTRASSRKGSPRAPRHRPSTEEQCFGATAEAVCRRRLFRRGGVERLPRAKAQEKMDRVRRRNDPNWPRRSQAKNRRKTAAARERTTGRTHAGRNTRAAPAPTGEQRREVEEVAGFPG